MTIKIMICVIVTVVIGCAAISPPKNGYTNLKVLPKDISSKDMSKIMVDEMADALGVSCGFCHAEKAGSHQLDYASDAKPEKAIARQMMRMTMRINKRYFKLKHPKLQDNALAITCNTCHNGQPFPGDAAGK